VLAVDEMEEDEGEESDEDEAAEESDDEVEAVKSTPLASAPTTDTKPATGVLDMSIDAMADALAGMTVKPVAADKS
jgi:hypothetical protein